MKTELKVGIFAIIVIIFLSYMTFKVSTLGIAWKKGYRLYVTFDNVSGLDEKSRVKIAGVSAGMVEKILLKDGKAELVLLMDPKIKVYEDAEASLTSVGFLGDKNLDLWAGTPTKKLLKNGDRIKHTKPAFDINVLANKLISTATYVSELAETIQSIFGEAEKEALAESIRNLRVLTKNFNEILEDGREPLQNILVRLESFSESLDDKGPEFVDNLNKLAKDLREMVEENRSAFKESVENIKVASESAGNIVKKIEKGEGTIGKLYKDEELYESLSSVAEGVGKTFDVVNKTRTFFDFSSEYLTKEGDWKGYFNLTLQPSKDKSYILGVVTDPFGSTEIIDTEINGVTTREEKTERNFEFTIQFAKRFADLALRIGMLESTFGVGADYFLFDDKAKLSFDAWDFSADEARADKAHMKIGFDYTFFKYFFIGAGMDNLLNDSRRGIFIGGGLKFEDEDFKYLFGASPRIPSQ
jgi:phospholipid/cholesterol/gamma-HCH transport system substrate-binding protein